MPFGRSLVLDGLKIERIHLPLREWQIGDVIFWQIILDSYYLLYLHRSVQSNDHSAGFAAELRSLRFLVKFCDSLSFRQGEAKLFLYPLDTVAKCDWKILKIGENR